MRLAGCLALFCVAIACSGGGGGETPATESSTATAIPPSAQTTPTVASTIRVDLSKFTFLDTGFAKSGGRSKSLSDISSVTVSVYDGDRLLFEDFVLVRISATVFAGTLQLPADRNLTLKVKARDQKDEVVLRAETRQTFVAPTQGVGAAPSLEIPALAVVEFSGKLVDAQKLIESAQATTPTPASTPAPIATSSSGNSETLSPATTTSSPSIHVTTPASPDPGTLVVDTSSSGNSETINPATTPSSPSIIVTTPASPDPGTLVVDTTVDQPPAQAPAPSPEPAVESPEPEGDLQLNVFLIQQGPGGSFAENLPNRFKSWFEPDRVRLRDFQSGTELLALLPLDIGRDQQRRTLVGGELRLISGRSETAYPDVTVWYVNRASGLEQGFDVASKPAGNGDLELRLNIEAEYVDFHGDHFVAGRKGFTPISYHHLKVFDAGGRVLPSRFNFDGASTLSICVDDSSAVYPIVIDPALSVTLANPASGATISKTPTIAITYSEAVVDSTAANGAEQTANYALSGVGANGQSPASVSGNTAGPYVFSLSNLATGAMTLTIQNVETLTGNVITTGNVISYTVDATLPTVSTAVPASSAYVNSLSPTVQVYYSESMDEATSGSGARTPGSYTYTGAASNGVTTTSVAGSGNGAYTMTLSGAFVEGSVTLNVASAVADIPGNAKGSVSTYTFTTDVTQPTPTITPATGTTTNSNPITFTIGFNETVMGFDLTDIAVTGGSKNNFATVSGNQYTFELTPTSNGTVTVNVGAAACSDQAGNTCLAATQASVVYDGTAPTVVITEGVANPTNVTPITYTFGFSETVYNFTVGDISVGNGAKANFQTLAGNAYSCNVIPTTDGTVTVDVSASVCTDLATNNNTAATQHTLVYDGTLPSVQSTSPVNGSTISSYTQTLTVTFSENVTNGTTAADYTFSGNAGYNVTVSSVSGSNSGPYTLTLNERLKSGDLKLTVASKQDAATNTMVTASFNYTVVVTGVATYRFNSGSGADGTVNGLNATLAGTSVGSGFQFEPDGLELGTAGTLTTTNLDNGNFPQNQGSLTFWYKPLSVSDTSALVFDQSAARNHFYVGSTATPGTYLFVAQKTDSTSHASSTFSLDLNRWNMISITWIQTGNIILYINGASVYSAAMGSWRPDGQDFYSLPKGQLDEMRLYDAVIPPATISTNHSQYLTTSYNFNSDTVSGTTVSDTNINVTTNFGRLYGTTGIVEGHHVVSGQAVDLDSATDSFDTPMGHNFFPKNTGSLEYWIRPYPVTNTTTYLLDEMDTTRKHFFIRSQTASGNYQFGIQDPNSSATDKIAASANVEMNLRAWNHVALTWKSTGSANMYLNGNLVLTTSMGNWTPSQQIVGSTPVGTLDDMNLYATERTATQIQTEWLKYTTPSSFYDFNVGNYTVNYTTDTYGHYKRAWHSGTPTIDVPRHAVSTGNSLNFGSGAGFSTFDFSQNLFPQEDGTVQFWVKPTKVTDNSALILDQQDTSRNHFFITSNTNTETYAGNYLFGIQDKSLSNGLLGSVDFKLLTNRWNHMAITWSSSNGKANFFMDGQPLLSSAMGSWRPSKQIFSSTPNSSFDDFEVLSSAWTSSQVLSHFETYVTPSGNYSFDDSTYTAGNLMLADTSGKFNHGRFSAVVSTTEGHQQTGEAKILNAGVGFEVFPLYTRRFPQNEGTLHFWVAPNSTTDTTTSLFDVQDPARNHFSMNSAGTAGFYNFVFHKTSLQSSSNILINHCYELQLDIFNHLAVTWSSNSGTVDLYVNGYPVKSTSIGEWRPTHQYVVSTPNGRLDDMFILNTAMSANQVWSYFTSYVTASGQLKLDMATITGARDSDASSNYNHGLLSGNPTIQASGGHHSTGDSVLFDGDDVLSIPTLKKDFFPINEGMLRFWFKPSSGVTDSTTELFESENVNRNHFWMRSNGAEGYYRFVVQDTSASATAFVRGQFDFFVDVGQWNMLAINWSSDRGDINLIVNDAVVFSTQMGSWRPLQQYTQSTPKGQLDDFLVTKDYLSTHQILAYYHSYVSQETSGALLAWGNGDSGELGTGTPANLSKATPATDFFDWIRVDGGVSHTLGLRADGSMWAWGANHKGQLGDGTTNASARPVRVSLENLITDISCGDHFSAAILSNKTVKAWGINDRGQLGAAAVGLSLTTSPTLITGITTASRISSGANHCIVLDTAGAVKAWGGGESGQLGNGANANSSTVVSVSGLTAVATAIAAGDHHNLALLNTGTVMAWGQNNFGQLGDGTTTNRNTAVAVSGLSGVSAIAAGQNHSVALLSNGNVMTWGYNNDGQLGDGTTTTRKTPVTVSSTTSASAIAAGKNHNLVLMSGGNVKAWGDGFYSQLGSGGSGVAVKPVAADRVTAAFAIGVGAQNSFAMIPKSSYFGSYAKHIGLYTFDDNTADDKSGNKNHGSFRSSPVSVTGHHNKGKAFQFSGTGESFYVDTLSSTLFPAKAGTLRFWLKPHSSTTTNAPLIDVADTSRDHFYIRQNGSDGVYEFAIQTSAMGTINSTSFTAALDAWNYISVSWDTSLQKADLYVIGSTTQTYTASSLGTWTPSQQIVISTPDGILDNFEVQDTYTSSATLANHYTQSITTSSGDYVKAWGYNGNGELGDGTNIDRLAPVLISAFANVKAVAAGHSHTLVLMPDGTLKAFGNNSNGQLGTGNFSSTITPATLSLTGVTAIAAGSLHSLALLSSGNVVAWGDNGNGQLGDNQATLKSNTPLAVSGLTSGVTAIAAGAYHNFALKSDGTVWAWGYNLFGQLGDGSTTTRNTPVQITSLTTISQIACGLYHSLALQNNGVVKAWGYNAFGQLGDGTTLQRLTPVSVSTIATGSWISAGSFHSLCAAGGTVYAWGQNAYGQVGNGTNTNVSSPANLSLTNVSRVRAGIHHSVALTSLGKVITWGRNQFGQLGIGSTTDSNIPNTLSTLSGVILVETYGNHTFSAGE